MLPLGGSCYKCSKGIVEDTHVTISTVLVAALVRLSIKTTTLQSFIFSDYAQFV